MTMKIASTFSKWATGFSGCDGGDAGDSSNKGIWICGIEWGGGHDANVMKLTKMFEDDVSTPNSGYEDWKHNLGYI